jgi:predicted acetyltransferase
MEIKTLYLIDPMRSSGKGYASDMLAYVLNKATLVGAKQVGATVLKCTACVSADFCK